MADSFRCKTIRHRASRLGKDALFGPAALMTAYMIKQNVTRQSSGEGEGWRQLRFCHSQKFSFPPHHFLNAPPLNIQSPKCVNFSKWNGVTPGRTAGFQGGNQEWRRQRNEDANEGMIFYFSPPPWSSQFEQSAWDEMRWNLRAPTWDPGVITDALVLGSDSCDCKSGEQNRKDLAAQLKCGTQLTL